MQISHFSPHPCPLSLFLSLLSFPLHFSTRRPPLPPLCSNELGRGKEVPALEEEEEETIQREEEVLGGLRRGARRPELEVKRGEIAGVGMCSPSSLLLPK